MSIAFSVVDVPLPIIFSMKKLNREKIPARPKLVRGPTTAT
jgi:hypothetical protein